MKKYLKFIFHALPLIPFIAGNNLLVLASVLMILLAYIKVFKLEQHIKDCENEEFRMKLKRVQDVWLSLTFLREGRLG